jgi:hypothetical protein
MPDRAPRPRGPFKPDGLAIAMISVGGLILTLCGSCTGFFALPALWGVLKGSYDSILYVMVLVVALVVGGLPTAGGIVLLVAGIGRGRRGKAEPPPRPPTTFVD